MTNGHWPLSCYIAGLAIRWLLKRPPKDSSCCEETAGESVGQRGGAEASWVRQIRGCTEGIKVFLSGFLGPGAGSPMCMTGHPK